MKSFQSRNPPGTGTLTS